MDPKREHIINSIDRLAQECDAAGYPEAGSVLRAVTAAMFAKRERELMEHVKEFSWRLLKQIVALRN